MQLNTFIWENYKNSPQGQMAIQLFETFSPDVFAKYLSNYFLNTDEICSILVELYHNSNYDLLEEHNEQAAYEVFERLMYQGIILYDEDGVEYDEILPDYAWYLDYIVPISSWLYMLDKNYFKPYFFIHNAKLLLQIADNFGIQLPDSPVKRDKKARFHYYWEVCQSFYRFELENNFSPTEMCVFLYDFCPKYFANQTNQQDHLPEPTQAWFIGANKVDFDFLDNFDGNLVHFWQGNLETKRGDILIMYCLSPRSYIHSIWRATTDGVVAPFFHWYSNIYIQNGQKITPIPLEQLKQDTYFLQNKLVRKNFQGVNGFPVSPADYQRLQELIALNGDDISQLPKLFSPNYQANTDLNNERDVEIHLIEPFLKDIDDKKQWIRQLTVKMGRGERVFPDYVLLSENQKGYEQAAILLETKFHIQNHKDLEAAFKQVWSYGLRLSASLLMIADKNAIWLYEKNGLGFDRNQYHKFFWKELQQTDLFNFVQQMIRKHFPK